MNSWPVRRFYGEDPATWLSEIEDWFDELAIPMDRFVDLAVPYLRGEAMSWAFENASLICKGDWCAFSYHLLWEFDPSTKAHEEKDEFQVSAVDGEDNIMIEVPVLNSEEPFIVTIADEEKIFNKSSEDICSAAVQTIEEVSQNEIVDADNNCSYDSIVVVDICSAELLCQEMLTVDMLLRTKAIRDDHFNQTTQVFDEMPDRIVGKLPLSNFDCAVLLSNEMLLSKEPDLIHQIIDDLVRFYKYVVIKWVEYTTFDFYARSVSMEDNVALHISWVAGPYGKACNQVERSIESSGLMDVTVLHLWQNACQYLGDTKGWVGYLCWLCEQECSFHAMEVSSIVSLASLLFTAVPECSSIINMNHKLHEWGTVLHGPYSISSDTKVKFSRHREVFAWLFAVSDSPSYEQSNHFPWYSGFGHTQAPSEDILQNRSAFPGQDTYWRPIQSQSILLQFVTWLRCYWLHWLLYLSEMHMLWPPMVPDSIISSIIHRWEMCENMSWKLISVVILVYSGYHTKRVQADVMELFYGQKIAGMQKYYDGLVHQIDCSVLYEQLSTYGGMPIWNFDPGITCQLPYTTEGKFVSRLLAEWVDQSLVCWQCPFNPGLYRAYVTIYGTMECLIINKWSAKMQSNKIMRAKTGITPVVVCCLFLRCTQIVFQQSMDCSHGVIMLIVVQGHLVYIVLLVRYILTDVNHHASADNAKQVSVSRTVSIAAMHNCQTEGQGVATNLWASCFASRIYIAQVESSSGDLASSTQAEVCVRSQKEIISLLRLHVLLFIRDRYVVYPTYFGRTHAAIISVSSTKEGWFPAMVISIGRDTHPTRFTKQIVLISDPGVQLWNHYSVVKILLKKVINNVLNIETLLLLAVVSGQQFSSFVLVSSQVGYCSIVEVGWTCKIPAPRLAYSFSLGIQVIRTQVGYVALFFLVTLLFGLQVDSGMLRKLGELYGCVVLLQSCTFMEASIKIYICGKTNFFVQILYELWRLVFNIRAAVKDTHENCFLYEEKYIRGLDRVSAVCLRECVAVSIRIGLSVTPDAHTIFYNEDNKKVTSKDFHFKEEVTKAFSGNMPRSLSIVSMWISFGAVSLVAKQTMQNCSRIMLTMKKSKGMFCLCSSKPNPHLPSYNYFGWSGNENETTKCVPAGAHCQNIHAGVFGQHIGVQLLKRARRGFFTVVCVGVLGWSLSMIYLVVVFLYLNQKRIISNCVGSLVLTQISLQKYSFSVAFSSKFRQHIFMFKRKATAIRIQKRDSEDIFTEFKAIILSCFNASFFIRQMEYRKGTNQYFLYIVHISNVWLWQDFVVRSTREKRIIRITKNTTVQVTL